MTSISSNPFCSGTRVFLSDLDILNLKRADFVAFSIATKNKTKVNVSFTTEKGNKKEYMFYVLSELVERYPSSYRKVMASVIFKPATLNIEWLSIISLIDSGDELEVIWCSDYEVTEVLESNDLSYDCCRIVIHKPDHRQYHIRLHTQVGDQNTRLIKFIR